MDEIYSKQFGESASNETEVSLNEIDQNQVEDSEKESLQDEESFDNVTKWKNYCKTFLCLKRK